MRFVNLKLRNGEAALVHVDNVVMAAERPDGSGTVDLTYLGGYSEEFEASALDELAWRRGFVSLTKKGQAMDASLDRRCVVNADHVGRFSESPGTTYVHFFKAASNINPIRVTDTFAEINYELTKDGPGLGHAC